MKSHNICVKNYLLWDSLALCYERNHEFSKANDCYLEGIDRKVDNIQKLEAKYNHFEQRMASRINREISNCKHSSSKINEFIQNDLRKVNFY